ncbi:MAG: TetR family transcriptional regulator [Actinomycetales bacterium]|jgi:AcrR family transcriptional regulator
MSATGTREAIVGAARTLFAERGYHSVTIKDVGSLAGYSPAMVMKVMGSKAELYDAAAPAGPDSVPPLPARGGHDGDAAAELPGFALVRRLVERRDAGVPEPWASLPLRVLDAPESGSTREDIRERAVSWVADQIGSSPEARDAQLVSTLLLGLGSALRVLRIFDPGAMEGEELIRVYGALLQHVISPPAD